jgi:RHS repeat-associated protein
VYKYAFNGEEKDDETYGAGNEYDLGERFYDPRLGRMLSLDPLMQQYPWQSPYAYCGNSPIKYLDINGEGNGDAPSKLYTNTPAAKNVFDKGFDATKYGKYSNYNWFSTVADAPGTGRVGSGVTIGVEGIDVKNAHVISNTQTDLWNTEALKDMGFKDKNEFNRAQKTMSKEAYSKLYDEWRGRVNSKIGAYMDRMKKAAYYLERDASYAVTDALANSGTIKTLNGSATVVKALNGLKLAGKALIVVAVANDIYDVYSSEDKARTIVTKVGGWAGAAAASSATGAGLTATGIDFTGPWGWVAHGGACLIAGGIGYFAGQYVTQTVYDHIITKGAKPGMK